MTFIIRVRIIMQHCAFERHAASFKFMYNHGNIIWASVNITYNSSYIIISRHLTWRSIMQHHWTWCWNLWETHCRWALPFLLMMVFGDFQAGHFQKRCRRWREGCSKHAACSTVAGLNMEWVEKNWSCFIILSLHESTKVCSISGQAFDTGMLTCTFFSLFVVGWDTSWLLRQLHVRALLLGRVADAKRPNASGAQEHLTIQVPEEQLFRTAQPPADELQKDPHQHWGDQLHQLQLSSTYQCRLSNCMRISISFYINWLKGIGVYWGLCPCVSEALRIAAEERDMETLKRLLPAAAQNGVAEDREEGMTKRQCEQMKQNLRALGQWDEQLMTALEQGLQDHQQGMCWCGRMRKDVKHDQRSIANFLEAEVASARHVFDFEASQPFNLTQQVDLVKGCTDIRDLDRKGSSSAIWTAWNYAGSPGGEVACRGWLSGSK